LVLESAANLENYVQFFTKHGSSIQDLEIHERPVFPIISTSHESVVQENLRKLQQTLRLVPNLKTLVLHLEFIPTALPEKFIFDQSELQKLILKQVEYLELSSPVISLGKVFLEGLFTLLPNTRVLKIGKSNDDQDWNVFRVALQKLGHLHTVHRITRPGKNIIQRISTPSCLD